jgi:pimeloyl-ACP methyl ester carboxylesterase
MTDTIDMRTVTVWNGRLQIRFQVKGTGDPLVYLHPAGGLAWDSFLDDLATDHTIFAPEFPGTTPGNADAVHVLDDLYDVVLAYEEAIGELGLRGAAVVGSSFGGMLAAELGSVFPDLFGKLVLFDPPGLWRADHPASMDFVGGPPEDLPKLLFHDLESPHVRPLFAPPVNVEEAVDAAVAQVWAIGCTTKYLWPIADKGLHKRLHRLSAPTLVIWGEHDALVPPLYAEEFRRRIASCEVLMVPDCGHIPQIEQPETAIESVRAFLDPRGGPA